MSSGPVNVSNGGSMGIGGPDPVGPVFTSPTKDFSIQWQNYNSTHFVFRMNATTTGWIAIGFSNTTLMTDCDIIVAWVNSDATTTMVDTYSVDYLQPADDTSRGGAFSPILARGNQTASSSAVTFWRKFNTGDSNDFNIPSSGNMYIVYAYGSADGYPIGQTFGYASHGTTQFGFFEVDFMNNQLVNTTGGGYTPGSGGTSNSTKGCTSLYIDILYLTNNIAWTSGNFALTWVPNANTSTIHFNMTAKTTGWVYM